MNTMLRSQLMRASTVRGLYWALRRRSHAAASSEVRSSMCSICASRRASWTIPVQLTVMSRPDASVAMRGEITAAIEQATLLKRAAQLSDVGNVAAFVASDQARTMTASTVNISCGALMDY